MKLIPQEKLNKVLDKALLKHRPLKSEISLFKVELVTLIDHIDNTESEEFHKNLVNNFLKKAIYHDNNFINTKGRQDLVIHNGKDNKTSVGVIIEAKRPTNKADWFTPDKPNSKALQELVLYYLRERIECNNIDIKYLIATNINEWYIVEASYFDKLFYKNKQLVKHYEEWRDGKKVTKDTGLFYNDIAKPFIDSLTDEIPCTYFNLKEHEKALRNIEADNNRDINALFKILSPYHLLKASLANDSNELDEKFYKELLHIIGLEEAKDGGKNIIRRKIENRNAASLLEKAIEELKTEGLHKVTDLKSFGEKHEEQYFSIALELCITWINRILFLKLLEGQLINYHKGDQQHRFLNTATIHDFDELFKLFHKVLAVNISERTASIQQKYSRVPYLNSSLFDISDLEDVTIKINSIDSSDTLELLSSSVLKEYKKKNVKLKTLDYLFQFLDAYDFASESTGDTQEDNKTLINASVLGKVFEKINGYKDGSVYTPGFITMYMSRQSIRLAVVQKFNEVNNWTCNDFNDLKELIEYQQPESRNKANAAINDLKICDPAVGSGHFLVSALNEIIAIKSELNILQDVNGTRLKAYNIEVVNDELIITDEDAEIYVYNPKSPQSELIQQTLFLEKQTIIENCLFGVDINTNSVKICRLRLWIELLKNAYYRPDGNLETLPNIDINIKCGNSLLSRFAFDANLSKALKSIKYDVASYRGFVKDYKNCKDREVKRGLQLIIDGIKADFRTNLDDPFKTKISKTRGDLTNAVSELNRKQQWGEKISKELKDKIGKTKTKLENLEVVKETILSNVIYKNAFEWRFEFPEVLNNNGEYEGFDVIIGNPPYLNFKMYSSAERSVFKGDYREIFDGKADIYYYFFLQGLRAVKPKGIISYITSRYWLEAEFAGKLRKSLANNFTINEIIDFKNVAIFDGIGIKTSMATFQNVEPKRGDKFNYKFIDSKKIKTIDIGTFTSLSVSNDEIRLREKWVFGNESQLNIYKKIETDTVPLESIAECKQGILTGFDKAFVISNDLDLELEVETLKPWLKVGDVFKYFFNIREERSVIYPNEIDDIKNFPKLLSHLQKFKPRLESREEALKGNYRWFDLHRPRKSELFDSTKLICRYKASQNTFALDTNKFYSSADTTIVVLKKEYASEYDLKFLLALLNSKLLNFYFKSYGKLMDYRFEYYPGPVGQLRIKQSENQSKFVEIVNQIIKEKSKDHNNDTSSLENEIDRLVFQLYNLTPDEVSIVENSTVSKIEPERQFLSIEEEY